MSQRPPPNLPTSRASVWRRTLPLCAPLYGGKQRGRRYRPRHFLRGMAQHPYAARPRKEPRLVVPDLTPSLQPLASTTKTAYFSDSFVLPCQRTAIQPLRSPPPTRRKRSSASRFECAQTALQGTFFDGVLAWDDLRRNRKDAGYPCGNGTFSHPPRKAAPSSLPRRTRTHRHTSPSIQRPLHNRREDFALSPQ